MHELAINPWSSRFATSLCINWCIYLRPVMPLGRGFCSIEFSVPLLPESIGTIGASTRIEPGRVHRHAPRGI
jgi:hypothetical protein